MNKEKIEAFVAYGAENYVSIEVLRKMLPQCYLFFTFLSVGASLVGNVFVFGIVSLLVTGIYGLFIYTFPLWCPSPSFACRFVMNAVNLAFLSWELQIAMDAILYAGRYIDLRGIAISVAIQVISMLVCALFLLRAIQTDRYRRKQTASSAVNHTVILASSFAGAFLANVFLRISPTVVAAMIWGVTTALSVLLATLAAYHLMKYYYAKKYGISADTRGETVSHNLVFVPETSSPRKKVCRVLLWCLLLAGLAAVLYGMYRVSR